jgi:transcriptional regulator with XRE-family HTH domain
VKIGTLLKTTREKRHYSLDTLARRVRVSASTLSRIENHDRSRVPSSELLTRLARELELPADAVFAAAGRIPPDVVKWLLVTPGALEAVRGKMGAAA